MTDSNTNGSDYAAISRELVTFCQGRLPLLREDPALAEIIALSEADPPLENFQLDFEAGKLAYHGGVSFTARHAAASLLEVCLSIRAWAHEPNDAAIRVRSFAHNYVIALSMNLGQDYDASSRLGGVWREEAMQNAAAECPGYAAAMARILKR